MGRAKGKVTKPPTTPPPGRSPKPDLTVELFAPGMSLLHRAGLGGLACTLKAMERHYEAGLLRDAALPTPLVDGQFPWKVTTDSVWLNFGTPENAGCYLKKLFSFAFQIREGVIYLPGQYPDPPPSLAVRTAIQDGIQNTFLQHGPTCGSRSGERTVTVIVDEAFVSFTHDVFTSYKHQGWFWLDRDEKAKGKDPATGKKLKTGQRIRLHQSFPAVAEDWTLSGSLHEIDNKLSPGGIVRHDRFGESAIRETDAGLICLHFALVGCLTLSVNAVMAVLLIPEVPDLHMFSDQRRWLTPQTLRECRVAGAADAVLQAQIRVRARQSMIDIDVPGCLAMTCRPTQWNKKQKCRVATTQVSVGSDTVLDRYERALAWLPPRLKHVGEHDAYWVDSAIRPLIAENLASGRAWYSDFVSIYRSSRPHLESDRRGLNTMITDDQMFDLPAEVPVVRALHDALRARFRDISDIYRDRPNLRKQKYKDEADKWGRAFAGAMTLDQFRKALCDLFRRAGQNTELQERWQLFLPMLRPATWQHTRDLALIGICSYQPRSESETGPQATEVI
jgi:CRISPR-associated protein Cas8a1/Csx13